MSEVQLHGLALGEALASGGQGTVHALADDPHTVFKRYHNPGDRSFNEGSLVWLVRERARIAYAGGPIDHWAAWPKTIVRDGPRVVGFLMPRVPSDFTITIRGRPKLADLSFLATEPSPLWDDVPLPTDEQRVQILHDLAGAMHALHKRNIIVGDISFANVIWARIPRPRIMLLDCDAMRPPAGPPVLPPVETLDWDDPRSSHGPDLDTDRYKLALAVLRVLSRSLQVRPDPRDVATLYGVEDAVARRVRELLVAAAGPAGMRPTASQWVAALSGRETVAPQEMVRRKPVGAPPKPEMLPETKRSVRPVVPPGA